MRPLKRGLSVFIRRGVCLGLLSLALSGAAWGKDGTVTLLSLSHISGQLLPTVEKINKDTVSLGGLSHAAGVVQQVRREHPNALLLSDGNAVSGPMWRYFGGAPEFTAMSMAGVNVGTISLRELDYGWEHFKNALRYVKFPLVLSNVTVKDPEAAKSFSRSIILPCRDMKVGVFSLISPQILTTTTKPVKELEVLPDMVSIAREMVADLRKQGADVIIMLGNLTRLENQDLAEQVSGIHAIVGRFQELKEDSRPTFVRGPDNWLTTLLWSGVGAKFVGNLTLTTVRGRITEDSIRWRLMPVTTHAEPNRAILAVASEYTEKLNRQFETVLGTFVNPVDVRKVVIRHQESGLGDFVADALRWQYRTNVAFVNSGSIRGDKIFREGPFSEKTLQELFPFGNRTDIITIKGSALRQAMEVSASAIELPGDSHTISRTPTGGFLQVSGLRVTYNLSQPPTTFNPQDGTVAQWGSRLDELKIQTEDGGWAEMDDEAEYTVVLSDWLSGGGDRYFMFKDAPRIHAELDDYEVLIRYLRTFPEGRLELPTDGRITLTGEPTASSQER